MSLAALAAVLPLADAGASSAAVADYFHSFEPFGRVHFVAAVTYLGIALLLALYARRGYGTARERRISRSWGLFIFVWQAMEVTWYLLPQNFRPERSFPLQLCDLAAWMAGIALFTEKRWARTLLYYWGIGLSSQAFFTPVLTAHEGPNTIRFWIFWTGHTHIVGGALYELIARRYRPTWKDLRLAIAVTSTYALVMIGFNWATGFNYGFLGKTRPQNPTILDDLGEWPLRPLLVMLLGTSIFVALTAIWPLGRFISGRLRPAATADRVPS